MCLNDSVPPGGPHTAAVAVMIKEGRFLLIKRAERPDDPWSGQIGFPGGHWEPGEDLYGTVRREAAEEVGMDLEAARLLGVMEPDSPMNAPQLKVYPFVFDASRVDVVKTNEEVAAYRWTSKDELAEIAWRGRPAFLLGDWVIWGLTYRFIKKLIDCSLI